MALKKEGRVVTITYDKRFYSVYVGKWKPIKSDGYFYVIETITETFINYYEGYSLPVFTPGRKITDTASELYVMLSKKAVEQYKIDTIKQIT